MTFSICRKFSSLVGNKIVSYIVMLLAIASGFSYGASIYIPNASFESPNVGAGGATFSIDTWSINGTAGVAGNGWGGGQINLLNSDGIQIAWMNTDVGTSISQLLSDVYSVGSRYKLTVGLARGAWNPPNDDDKIKVQLFYSAAGNPVLGEIEVAASDLNWSNSSNLKDYSVELAEVEAGDAYLGMQIGVRIVSSFEGSSDGSGDWVIDNVRLEGMQTTESVTVPNNSFELPAVGVGGAAASIDQWSYQSPAGVAGNGWGSGAINVPNIDGGQVAWMNTEVGTAIWELLPETYVAGYSYKLSVGLARAYWNLPNDDDKIKIELFYSSAGNSEAVGETTIAASELNMSNGGSTIDYSVDVPEVLSSDLWVGLQIGIRIVSAYEGSGDSNGDWVIDNVRLEKQKLSDPGTIQPSVIYADDPFIQYSGRVNFDNPKEPVLWWPGNYIAAWFEGTSIKAKFNDLGNNYFAVIIDDNPEVVLDLGNGTGKYLLAGGLAEGVHKVVLFKRTETDVNSNEGSAKFLGFELDNGKKLVEPKPKPVKRIEFYGDSITAGFAVDSTSDNGSAPYKNNYLDYAARTARMLNAEYHCQAISGVGIYNSWWQYPPGDNASMYEDYYFLETRTKNWDFNKWIPHVVVINLGENDKNVGGVSQGQAEGYYRDFALALRGHYPDAHIIFALGSMSAADSATWKGYIENVVNTLNSAPYNDNKVYKLFFKKINASVNRHPVASEHLQMAETLKDFIIEKVPWFGYGDGNIDEDSHVNLYDFSVLAAYWLSEGCGFCGGSDVDLDQDVDVDDLMLTSSNWLEDISQEGNWQFEGNVLDSSWRDRNTIDSGQVQFENGLIALDGIDDYVEVEGYKGILGGASRTCFARIKTSVPERDIISWGGTGAGEQWLIHLNSSGKLQVSVQGGYVVGKNIIADNAWHSIAVVLENDGTADVNNLSLYVDGAKEPTSLLVNQTINTDSVQDVQVGLNEAKGVKQYFQGYIDEIRIYRKAMSDSEAMDLTCVVSNS